MVVLANSAVTDVHPSRLAVARSKLWPNGSTLTIKFLDDDPTWQEEIVVCFRIWLRHANLRIKVVTEGTADIRIEFNDRNEFSSYVGTDCQQIVDENAPTMSLDMRSVSQISQRYHVLHEIGHALGCIHEHQSPAANFQWLEAVMYEFYQTIHGWTRDDVYRNLIRPADDGTIYSEFDKCSIMMYPILPGHAECGGEPFVVGQNFDLSPTDMTYFSSMYPHTSDTSERHSQSERSYIGFIRAPFSIRSNLAWLGAIFPFFKVLVRVACGTVLGSYSGPKVFPDEIVSSVHRQVIDDVGKKKNLP
ncbi:unnamed protein product [Calypogeia fissa]